jgi:cytosol aminopeptidase
MFLKAFVPEEHLCDSRWAHLDIAASAYTKIPGSYQEKGKTGRPVRALIEWARHFSEVHPIEKVSDLLGAKNIV